MKKYAIESVYNDRLKNDLTFGTGEDNVLLFGTPEEAEEKMFMYGCVNCRVIVCEA